MIRSLPWQRCAHRFYGDYAAQLGLEDKADIDQAITDILVSTDETKAPGTLHICPDKTP